MKVKDRYSLHVYNLPYFTNTSKMFVCLTSTVNVKSKIIKYYIESDHDLKRQNLGCAN